MGNPPLPEKAVVRTQCRCRPHVYQYATAPVIVDELHRTGDDSTSLFKFTFSNSIPAQQFKRLLLRQQFNRMQTNADPQSTHEKLAFFSLFLTIVSEILVPLHVLLELATLPTYNFRSERNALIQRIETQQALLQLHITNSPDLTIHTLRLLSQR